MASSEVPSMHEPFVAEQRVLYGDTDAMGIAYYAT
jgi:acyl-CoA thioesterase FadM